MRATSLTRLACLLLSFALYSLTLLAQSEPGVMGLTEEQYQRARRGESIDVSGARDQVYKSCADGAVDRWMLFWTVNIPDSDEYALFDFKTNREGELPLAERYGNFVQTEIDYVNHQVYFKVNRPRFLREQYGLFRRDSIIVTYDNVPQSNYDATVIDVYRAPVLFLHGLGGGLMPWDFPFEDMQDEFEAAEYQIPELMYRPIYTFSSFGSIDGHSGIASQAIYDLLDDAREHGFFVGKVDVVAHSLGGLMARVYAQSLAGLTYRKDIRTLITINTPHSGSELANYTQDDWSYLYLCGIPGFSQMFACGGGAISDLRTDSELIDELLNTVQFQFAPNLQCRSVVTWDDTWLCDVAPFVISNFWSTPLLPESLTVLDVGDCQSLFNGQPNDGVVKVISQRGGLSGSRTSIFGDQWHLGSMNNDYVINDVRAALLTDPRGAKFSQWGFHPVDIMPPAPAVRSAEHRVASSRRSGSLAILQPSDGTEFEPGDTISFVIECSGDVNFLAAVVGNDQVGYLPWDTSVTTSPTIVQWVIPDSWLGDFQVSVVAFDASMSYVADDQASFVVSTDALPTQLTIEPDEIFCTQGAMSFYEVFATYSDGNVVNVTQAAGTMAGIANGAAATIQQPGVILGVSPDSTTMTVFYEGLVATADVYVYATDTTNIDDAQFAADERFFCGGDAVVHFYDWSGGTPDSIRWSFPGGVPVTSTESEPIVTYAALGDYPVQLIAHYGIYSDTLLADSFIVVNEAPAVVVELVSGVLQCTGDAVELYVWYLDGEVLTADSGATLTPPVSGDYSVVVTDSMGCSTATEPYFVEVSTSIRPGIFSEGLRVYPNPAAGELWVASDRPITAYSVSNVLGEVVLNASVPATKRFSLSLGRLCAGAYALNLTTPDQGSIGLRFVKE